MRTEFFNDQWRIPSDENQNKVSNYSMNFDGTSDNIDIGQIDITGTKSVAFWIYPTASGDDGAHSAGRFWGRPCSGHSCASRPHSCECPLAKSSDPLRTPAVW